MALVNTGLGWMAESNWLRQSATPLGSQSIFGGAAFPGQPIPKYAETADDVLAAGFTVGESAAYSAIYYVATEGPANVVVYFPTPMDGSLHFISSSNTEYVRLIRYRTDTHAIFAEDRKVATTPVTVDNVTVYHGTLFDAGFAASWEEYFTFNVPRFSSDSDADSSLVITTKPFFKFNTGFGVACVAKWVNRNLETVYSPVVISSKSEFTVISYDPYRIVGEILTTGILYQGMRFYITLCMPLTTDPIVAAPGIETIDLSEIAPGGIDITDLFKYIARYDYSDIVVITAPDPYEEEGSASGEEGGDGEDIEDDPVEEETMPIPSAAQFCTIYVPTAQELGQMASYLWSGAFDVSQVIKLFSSPMDSILGLSAVPVDLVGVNPPDQIYLGGVALPNVTMHRYAGRTAVPVDCGTVTVAERWGSYLDYAPYTEFSVYLPFIGIKTLKADDIMGKTISLKYNIDILSGGCVAYLRPAGGSVLYEWSGQCALQIPVTGRSYDNVFQSAMSVATAALAAVTAPASAPVLSGAVASAAVQAATTKPHIERSGTVNGITGFLGQLRPYLIRTIPDAYIPADQNKFIGYPAYINVDLNTVRGYNEVDSIHLENVTATGAELEEIESILKGGVIF